MKARRIDLSGIDGPTALADRIVRARFEEARDLAPALEKGLARELHDFRIACKRLRYAMERFCALRPEYEAPAKQLANLQDALGETHDRDVLLAILPPSMPLTEARLLRERGDYVVRAAALWSELRERIQ